MSLPSYVCEGGVRECEICDAERMSVRAVCGWAVKRELRQNFKSFGGELELVKLATLQTAN